MDEIIYFEKKVEMRQVKFGIEFWGFLIFNYYKVRDVGKGNKNRNGQRGKKKFRRMCY